MSNNNVIKFLLSNGFEEDEYDENMYVKDDKYFVNIDDTDYIDLHDENGNNFMTFDDFNSFKTYLIENRII
jgi:hypothetical protein